MKSLLLRGALCIVNTSSIPTLLQRVQRGQGTAVTKTNLAARHAQVLLTHITKFCPALCKAHVDDLIATVEDGKNDMTIAVALQALAGVVRLDPVLLPMNEYVVQLAL